MSDSEKEGESGELQRAGESGGLPWGLKIENQPETKIV